MRTDIEKSIGTAICDIIAREAPDFPESKDRYLLMDDGPGTFKYHIADHRS